MSKPNKKTTHKFQWWPWLDAFLPPLAWAGVIFIISSQKILPGPDVFLFDFILKKVAHMGVYAVLYWLVWRGVNMTFADRSTTFRLLFPILICLFYAASDEFHQSLVPGRYPTFRDVGYDMLGVGLVFLKKYNYL